MKTRTLVGRTGFTLIEMLVVLAIIAVLSALLFPMFARVREGSRGATCQSHLKQIALAVQQYVSDFDGHYPEVGVVGVDQKQWATHIASYIRNPQVLLCPTRDALGLGAVDALNVSSKLNYDFNVLRLNSFAARRVSGRPEAALVLASQTWLNTDSDVNGPHSYPPGASVCGPWWMPQWGQELHSGGANYSFVDGHVKWLNPGQIETIECELGDPHFAGR